MAGIGMIMLSRGILKGQRRSWIVAVALLVASLALHLIHAAGFGSLLVCAGVLTLLIVQRERFRAQTESATIVTAFVILAIGGLIATLGGFVAVEVAGRVHHHPLPAWPNVLLGSAERLVGVQWVEFPRHHRPLRLHQPAGRRHQPHRGGALSPDPARRRPAPFVRARRHGPARRRAAGP